MRTRGLHELAPELWSVMLIDENGHAKVLPFKRRGGELYGADAILGDVLVCQQRRSGYSVEELSGFSQEQAQLRELLLQPSHGHTGPPIPP